MTREGSTVVQGLVVALMALWAFRFMLIRISRGWLEREAAWLEAAAARCPPQGRLARLALKLAHKRRQVVAESSGGCAGGCGSCRSSRCQGSER